MWRKLVGTYRDFGVAAGFLYALSRLLTGLSPRLNLFVYEMMAQSITANPLLPERLTRNLSFCEITRGSPEVEGMPARTAIKAARFEQGARCLGAYKRGTLIGYVWWSAGQYAEDEVRCDYRLPIGAAAVFDFDLYVLPEHRMGIGFMAIWHGFNGYLCQCGMQQTFSRMTRFNLPSRRAHRRLGAVCVGRIVVLQLAKFELMLATMSPFLSVSLRRRTPLQLPWPVNALPSAQVVSAKDGT